MTQVVLDLSRLLSRAHRPTPTGIDRVELAYAKHLIATQSDRLIFAGVTGLGWMGLLRFQSAVDFIGLLDAIWHGRAAVTAPGRVAALARQLRLKLLLSGERGLAGAIKRSGAPAVYLLVSHHHLNRPALIQRLKQRTGARFVCLVHDLIPMEFPEYNRPGQDQIHRRRMTTVAQMADAVIVNSEHTRSRLESFLAPADRKPKVVTAPLGVDTPRRVAASASQEAPYFLCIGTIEAKKNHLLLLNLWRRFAEDLGATAPRLVLVGVRGWEVENVVDMIERCAPLRGLVDERGAVSDQMLLTLMAGATALLAPTFAEGYGLPIAEALAHGLPVLCSDLPSHREIGGDAPEYLDPLDGPGWGQAILDYAAPQSPRRMAQLDRMGAWTPPCWADHFAIVDSVIGEAARNG